MTPAERLTPDIVQARKRAFLQGDTTTHWPELCRVTGGRKNKKNASTLQKNYRQLKLTTNQRKLIPLDEGEEKSTGEEAQGT